MPNRNGIVHESIIDKLRFNLPSIMESQFDDFLCIADECLMAGFCNNGNQKGERPDLILVYGEELTLIEVGTINNCKWIGLENKLIHISHNKAVGLINGTPTEDTLKVLSAIRNLLQVY
jgi:hypothetical protein